MIMGIMMAGLLLAAPTTDISFTTTANTEYITVTDGADYKCQFEKAESTQYVNASIGLNVRELPGTDKTKLDAYKYGTKVEIAGHGTDKETEDWYMIVYKDSYAFVHADYLQEDEPPKLEQKTVTSGNKTYLGNYMITAYEWTGDRCANGNWPSTGYTVACNSLPFGTRIYIEGVGERVVEDRGGGGSQWIDLYLGDESACYNWGVRYRDVYIIN